MWTGVPETGKQEYSVMPGSRIREIEKLELARCLKPAGADKKLLQWKEKQHEIRFKPHYEKSVGDFQKREYGVCGSTSQSVVICKGKSLK